METQHEVHKGADGSIHVVGVITHEGRTFVASGGGYYPEQGRAVVYPTGEGSGECYGDLWNGEALCKLVCTGMSRTGFHGTRLYSYRTVGPLPDGYHYYGRGLGKGVILRLRKGRKA